VAGYGTRIDYTYDFGDSWDHEILVEESLIAGNDDRYPILIDGAGACPPEDCGGSGGYAQLRETLADPSDKEHEHIVSWLGLTKASEFGPVRFDLDLVRQTLTEII
jgi:hypothetical protein